MKLFTHVLAAMLGLCAAARAIEPLDSWNNTAPRKAIISFVERVTREGSPDFVPPPERIAVMMGRSGPSSRFIASCSLSWTGLGRWRHSIPSGKPTSPSRRS